MKSEMGVALSGHVGGYERMETRDMMMWAEKV